MTKHSRRDLFRFGAMGAAAGALSLQPLRALSGATPPKGSEKLFVIYLRGAMDSVYTVAPKPGMDAGYDSLRASLQPNGFVSLSSFAQLNNSFGILDSAGGPIQNGDAAFVMQVGNPGGNRSHFTEQQIQETADTPTGASLNPEGFVARLAALQGFFPKLPMASVGFGLQRMMRSTAINAAHVKSLGDYNLAHEDSSYMGVDISGAMTGYADQLRTAMQSHYGQSFTGAGTAAVDSAALGSFVLDSEAEILGVTHNAADPDFPTVPGGGLPASFPGIVFMIQCQQALEILEQTRCPVVGVDLGGFDTHTNQKQQRDTLDPWLAKAIDSIYRRLLQASFNGTILVLSEFGRTNKVNSSSGTDHGVGGLMMAFGPRVNGGVYNMDAGSWLPMTATNPAKPQFNNALEVVTDFREVYVELLQDIYGLTAQQDIDTVVPPFTSLSPTPLNIFT